MSRPSKLSLKEKQAIVHEYLTIVGEGRTNILKNNNIYSRLARYANQLGYENVRYYDFARDIQLREYIDLLVKEHPAESTSNSAVYKSLDINYFRRPDVSWEKKCGILIERDEYYRQLTMHFSTQKNLIKSLQKELNELQARVSQLREENATLSVNFDLVDAQNKSLKKHLGENVVTKIAEKIVKQDKVDVKNIPVITVDEMSSASLRSHSESSSGVLKKALEFLE